MKRGFSRFSLFFSKTHEWVMVSKTSNQAKVGITDFAQLQLGDVCFVDMPALGQTFKSGEEFGSIESVKAASDLFLPVCGKVEDVNLRLTDEPSLINTDPMNEGWLIKISLTAEIDPDKLMDKSSYQQFCLELENKKDCKKD